MSIEYKGYLIEPSVFMMVYKDGQFCGDTDANNEQDYAGAKAMIDEWEAKENAAR